MIAAFDLLHPVVVLLYCVVLVVLVMTAMHPVYLGLALLGAFAWRACLGGWRDAVRTLRWQLPVVAVVAVANCLFVSSGSTEILRVGTHAFYAEALAYGACSGAMLACVLMLFGCASRVLTSDKVMAVLGNALPTVSLMVSMTLRLVPQFARRGRTIGDAARACTAANGGREDVACEKGGARRSRMTENLRMTTVLMGWGMEDALETADAMKARGWGASVRRTTYRRNRFRRVDALVCAVVALLAIAAAAAAWTACAQLSFYPRIAGFAPWYSYAPFALLVFLPAAAGLVVCREAQDA